MHVFVDLNDIFTIFQTHAEALSEKLRLAMHRDRGDIMAKDNQEVQSHSEPAWKNALEVITSTLVNHMPMPHVMLRSGFDEKKIGVSLSKNGGHQYRKEKKGGGHECYDQAVAGPALFGAPPLEFEPGVVAEPVSLAGVCGVG